MRNKGWNAAILMASGLSVLLTACGSGSGTTTPPPPTTYVLTVHSTSPASGVVIAVSPADNGLSSQGTTSFTLTYNSGAAIVLTAPATAGANVFTSWTGCTTTSGDNCSVTISANTTVTANYTAPTPYTLTVNSASPSSGVAITVTPADNNAASNGTTSFTRTYNSGTAVTLTAPTTAGGNNFSAWTGCTTISTVTCNVTISANTTVTATYVVPAVAVTPNPATVTIGIPMQFSAAVNGTASTAVTWAVAAPAGSTLSAGTISSTGLYTSPYPAPATVTVTATNNANSSQSGSATVTLAPAATAAGPALTVDAGSQTHAINPFIYGMSYYNSSADTAAAESISLPVDRWGGDGSQRYNYVLDVINSASDYYFENHLGNLGVEDTGAFNTAVEADAVIGAKTLGTVDVLGWVSKDATSCSYTATAYPQQLSFDQYDSNCGDGTYPNGVSGCTNASGCQIPDPTNEASITSTPVTPAWAKAWVTYLVGKFGTAANGGVYAYDLDNEPAWWDAVHRDVHPVASTYDEVTVNGMATAVAVKSADPTALINGPVIDNWWNYFYSKQDMESGWGTGPCYEPWADPTDRAAHGGVPFIEYYLQQFAAYQATNNVRLLDYLDMHTYFAATYNGNGVAFATAGDTGEQQARVNSTRVFWDPTYTDPNYPQPNYSTDSNYTTNCNTPLQAPQLIPMAKGWIAKDYPGTKLAFSEYNWGGQESINGAIAQADILGIFGSYGLDMATLWGPPDPTTQVPGLMAYKIYRNYDGAGSKFGDMALTSTSANQGVLSVYGALRTADNAVTIMVINKTYGDLTETLSLANVMSTGTAQAFLYSNANLAAIAPQANLTVTAPGTTASTISTTFPAQSITLLVVPQT
jgi:Glycoside hydrolase family 44